MVRRLLALVLLLLVAFALSARLRAFLPGGTVRPNRVVAESLPDDLTLRHVSRDAAISDVTVLPGEAVTLPDSLARAGARLRLNAETDRQYLDSLFPGTDSTVRHWPVDGPVIGLAIVPSGVEGFIPEMVSEVRQALDLWSPASAGIRFLELPDTIGARMVVQWTDTLEADRAGATDVTWDKAGRVHRVIVTLAVRSPSTGRPFAEEARRAIVLHELGHALGLPHSSRVGDVMYPVATALGLTGRDRFSLRLLYELPTGWIGATLPETSER